MTSRVTRRSIDLGMMNDASDWDDRMTPEILTVCVDLYHAAKDLDLMADITRHLAESYIDESGG